MSSTETPAASCADILSMLVASRGYMAATDSSRFTMEADLTRSLVDNDLYVDRLTAKCN